MDCSFNNTCTVCKSDYFLKVSENSCTLCDKQTDIKNGTYCLDCVENCEICDAKKLCLVCKPDFFLKAQDDCVLIRKVYPEISFGPTENLVFLEFFSKTQIFVEKFIEESEKYLVINIAGLKSTDFSYSIMKNSSSKLQFIFDYKKTVNKGAILEIKVNQYDWMYKDLEEPLSIFSFSLSLNETSVPCKEGLIKSAGKK